MKYFLLFFFGIVWSAQAQHTIRLEGKVTDADSKEPLPFVNVSILNTTRGATSGIDGRFQLAISPEDTLVFTYVGYEKKILEAPTDPASFLMVELKQTSHQLREVEVMAGENPALRIIRNAVRNREVNNPENLESFSYHAYHKFYATVEGAMDAPGDTSRVAAFLRKNNLFLNESYSERKYIKPNLDKETVLGNRMTGVEDPFFAILATNFQPFSFYKTFITLFDKNYLNPISPGSINQYDFEIADTVLHEHDTTFIVKFEPLPSKAFEALKGLLYINTDGYALEHVLAGPADDQTLIGIRIQQKYHRVESHWFPEQLNTEFVLKEYKLAQHTIKYVHRSYFTGTLINAPLSRKEFGLLNVEFAPNANHRDENFWNASRLDSLTRKDANTYQLYDSMKGGRLASLNFMVKAVEAFTVGKFKAGKFYLPIENLVKVNKYENIRLGIGLQTSERISRWWMLDGYAGYGIRDKALKYGAGLQFNFNPSRDFFLRVQFNQDLREPGNSNFIRNPMPSSDAAAIRNWYAFRMDSIRQYKVMLHWRPLRFSQAVFFFQRQQDNPAYAYRYAPDDGIARDHFRVTEAGVQLRIAFHETYAQMGSSRIVTNIARPHINLLFSHAFDNVWDGEYDFTKIEARVDHQFLARAWGQTRFQVAGGYMQGNAPYPYLFNGKGSLYNRELFNSFQVPNYFQTMGLYEFLSDRYAYLFLQHNFGRLTPPRSQYFRPELSVVHNMGVGSLKNKSTHQDITFNTMEKGFFESGVMLDNILRVKYINILYYGFGAGVFYRYGAYALPEKNNNLVWKLIITVSF